MEVTTEVNELVRQLTDKFVPTMERELSAMLDSSNRVKVEYVPSQGSEHMMMFNLTIKVDSIDLQSLTQLAHHIEQFWVTDTTNTKYVKRVSDGRMAMLGDGDDAGAAWFEAGKFRIWLRVWDVGHDFGF